MPTQTSRTYHDPLHGAITLDRRDATERLLIDLIDTPAFQRLRRIRQLGPANLTFHGAETSRFTHSLGVLAIARRGFDRLILDYPQLKPYRSVVLVAALLHDLGHGPFSHTSEEIFGNVHEEWTERILQESPPLLQLLDRFDPQLLPQLLQVYGKSHPIPLVWQLITSQLDCDRLDYLMRDSYFTGTSYGHLDLDRILMALNYDPVTQQLVVVEKGLTAIEHYLIVRYFMYVQVYNHPKNLAATWVLEQAIQRSRELLSQGQLEADATMTAWLTHPDRLSLDQYLRADDTLLLYHLQRWRTHPDSVLADLCRRFLDRDLLKTVELTHLSLDAQQWQLERSLQLLAQTPSISHPHYYTGLRVAFSRGYTPYQKGIKLQTSQGLRELSDRSALVQTLTHPQQRTWLIYPREIAPGIGS